MFVVQDTSRADMQSTNQKQAPKNNEQSMEIQQTKSEQLNPNLANTNNNEKMVRRVSTEVSQNSESNSEYL